MGHLLRICTIFGLAFVAAGNGMAQPDETDGTRVGICTLTAILAGENPEDRKVHAAPDAASPVLTQLEGPYTIGGDDFYPEAEITGSENGWFRIEEAMTDIYIVETPVRQLFEGEGWIHGSNLRLWVEGSELFAQPSGDSSIVFDFAAASMNDQEGGIFDLDRLVACHGYWVEVEGTYLGQSARGWTRDVCASQVTTCP